jgi:internalin A
LRILDISFNKVAFLPEAVSSLTQLRILNVHDNRLATLSESIGRLIHLEELYLGNNKLDVLPDAIGQLSQLNHLAIFGNRLSTLPESMCNLTQLMWLNAGRNLLTSLPDGIGQLKQLRVLALYDNHINRLPESLRELKLEQLYLHNNTGLALPAEVLGPAFHVRRDKQPTAPSEILEYYFRTRGGQRALNEAKLILIGRGEAGKTSIVNRLLYNRFDPSEKKTEGIKIDTWDLSLRDERVRLNVWDFGGQEIMHATHQFFLTQRSLYLLLLTGRGDSAEDDANYWLKLVGSFGGSSPVIVDLNKIKLDPFDINRRALQGKYPSIKGFVETDCADGSGLEELRRTIERETDLLDGLRDSFPAAWFKIKDELAGMKQNYLTYDEYRAKCAKLGETDSTAQEKLTVYLHRLGIALNYREDPRLRDTHVLNPHWVTNGIYTILNSQLIKERHGDIHLEDLSQLLDSTEYPPGMHRFLMDLMKRFDLCFTFPNDDIRYLIPELLDIQEPEDVTHFAAAQSLNFRYDYPIVPEGLLPRFIVRTHNLSEALPRWRTGVILALEGCRALIKADPQDKRVDISVAGPAEWRRRLLAVIRAEFEQIHRDIRELNPQEMVPLPGSPAFAVPYQDLLVRERSGKLNFDMVIEGKLVPLNAHDLLEGVDLEGSRKIEQRMPAQEASVRLFCSYSHKDESYRNDLETHLKILQRRNVIDSWSDRLIGPGDEWKESIDENLQRADIIVLLISADFMSSDYCYEIEMKAALKRHDEGKASILPIIVRDVVWKNAPFAKLQALPKEALPVSQWPDKDSAWRNVAEDIERLAEQIREHRRADALSDRQASARDALA